MLTVAVLLSTAAVIIAAARHQGWSLGNDVLVKYQTQKLRNAHGTQTIFIGDSDLGYGINADLWSRLSGTKTLNLALTASYGHGGFLNMMELAARSQPLKTVIIFESIGTAALDRATTYQGYLETLPDDTATFYMRVQALLFRAKFYIDGNVANAALNYLRRPTKGPGVQVIESDYVRQGGRDRLPEFLARAKATPMIRDQLDRAGPDPFLAQISDFCRKRGLNCMFAMGVITQHYCNNSQGYINALRTRVRQAGLIPMPNTPLCLRDDELGNAENHVRPEGKDLTTTFYYDQYKSMAIAPQDGRQAH